MGHRVRPVPRDPTVKSDLWDLKAKPGRKDCQVKPVRRVSQVLKVSQVRKVNKDRRDKMGRIVAY